MMLVLFSGYVQIINTFITTCYLTLSAETSNITMTSMTTMQIFIEKTTTTTKFDGV